MRMHIFQGVALGSVESNQEPVGRLLSVRCIGSIHEKRASAASEIGAPAKNLAKTVLSPPGSELHPTVRSTYLHHCLECLCYTGNYFGNRHASIYLLRHLSRMSS